MVEHLPTPTGPPGRPGTSDRVDSGPPRRTHDRPGRSRTARRSCARRPCRPGTRVRRPGFAARRADRVEVLVHATRIGRAPAPVVAAVLDVDGTGAVGPLPEVHAASGRRDEKNWTPLGPRRGS